MHIEVEQSMQHVAAARTRKFLPEEIDWVLTKMQDRFIQSCLKPEEGDTGGFEATQEGYDKIRNLIVANLPITAYIESATTYKCYLPAEYKYLVSNRSMVNYLCGSEPALATDTLRITRLQQTYSGLVLSDPHPKYYYSVIVVMPNKTITIPTDLPYGYTYDGYLQKPDVVNFLTPYLLYKAGTWYWERLDDLYYPGHYLQVQTSAPSAAVLTIDGSVVTSTGTDTKTLNRHTNAGIDTDNRLTASSMISRLQQNHYYKTSYYSPISELQGTLLRIYRDNSFIVSGAVVSYVRKAQPISLSLNSDCEIDESYHQAICDLTVEYLKGRVENAPGKQIITEDIAARVVI